MFDELTIVVPTIVALIAAMGLPLLGIVMSAGRLGTEGHGG